MSFHSRHSVPTRFAGRLTLPRVFRLLVCAAALFASGCTTLSGNTKTETIPSPPMVQDVEAPCYSDERSGNPNLKTAFENSFADGDFGRAVETGTRWAQAVEASPAECFAGKNVGPCSGYARVMVPASVWRVDLESLTAAYDGCLSANPTHRASPKERVRVCVAFGLVGKACPLQWPSQTNLGQLFSKNDRRGVTR